MARSTKADTTNRDDGRSSKKRKTAGENATSQHDTRDTPNVAPAREAVFNTPELLETIIACLPPRDIRTTVQRLSRRWNDAVSSSPTIKTKLFQSRGATASNPTQFTDVQNFPTAGGWVNMAYPMYTSDLTLNPNFYGKTLHGVTMGWEEGGPDAHLHDGMDITWSSPTLSLGSYVEEQYGQPSFGPSRTWREMYLTQPPITTGILQLHTKIEYQTRHFPTVSVSIRDHSGITLGLLHDTIAASLGPEIRKTMASGHGEFFWGAFTFVSDRENLTGQCLQTIFGQ